MYHNVVVIVIVIVMLLCVFAGHLRPRTATTTGLNRKGLVMANKG